MRVFLVILLIAMFPLRGFASVSMQTRMEAATLQQAAAIALPSHETNSIQANAVVDAATPSSLITACNNGECSACDACYSQIGQIFTSVTAPAVIRPPAPAALTADFTSAEIKSAQKPPLALL